jgi:hypothetical protein
VNAKAVLRIDICNKKELTKNTHLFSKTNINVVGCLGGWMVNVKAVLWVDFCNKKIEKKNERKTHICLAKQMSA